MNQYDAFMTRIENPLGLANEMKFLMTDIDSGIAHIQVVWESLTRDELARIDTTWLIHTAHIVHDVIDHLYRIYQLWNKITSGTEPATQIDTMEHVVLWEAQKVGNYLKQTLILHTLWRINDDIMSILVERGIFDGYSH